MASHDDEYSSGEETTSPQTEESIPSSPGEESGEGAEYSHAEETPSSPGEEGDSGDVDFSSGGAPTSDGGVDHSPGEGALPSEDSSSSAQDENYINNLILNIRALRSDVENSITLQSANIGQRELATSLLSVLEYGLENYAQSNFGCCQEICEIKTCYDPPQGYTSPEMLKKVSFLTNFSNIGIANIPDNAKFKIWWNSTENAMTRAFVDRYNVSLVNWLFEFFGLEKPTNKNLHGLTYAATAFLFYVVFGDPVLFLRVSEEFTQNKNVDKVLDLIAKDVFALEVNNWKDVLEDFNELLVAEAGSTPEASLQIQIDTIREVFVWIFENLQVSVNQLSENEACETVMGDKFPSYPGFLWILVNTILAVVFSFFIAGSRAKFGLKGNGGRRWVPYFGPKDLDITGIEDPTTLSHFEQIFNDARSPFSGFSIKNVYWEESGSVIVVQFNEEITDSTHPSTGSVLNPACYILSKETADGPFFPDDVVPHAEEFDKVILSTTKITSWSDDLKLLAGSGTIGPTAALYNYDDEDGEDECSMWSDNWSSTSVGRPIGKNKNSYVGRTFSDIAAWAAESGDSISNIKISFEYLIDWHTRNFTPEFQEAFNVLQSIGWMNLKGSDFAGFLHPDAACGALIENLFCEYYDSIEKDCIKVDIEGSCGIFDCEETWEDRVTRIKDSIQGNTDVVLETSDRLEALYREREEIESERAESKQDWDSEKTSIEAEIESNNCNDSQDTTQCTELRTRLESINSEEAERQRVYDDWYIKWQAKVAELQEVITSAQNQITRYAAEIEDINNPRWSDICLYDGDAPTLEECTPIIEEAVQVLRDNERRVTEVYQAEQIRFDVVITWLTQVLSCVQDDASDCLTTYPVPAEWDDSEVQTLADLTGISDDDPSVKSKRIVWLQETIADESTAQATATTEFEKFIAEGNETYALYAQIIEGDAPLTDFPLDCYGDRKPRSIVTKTDTSFYSVGTNDSQEAGLLFARKVNVATTYVHDTEADKFPTQGEAEARAEELGCTGYHQHGYATVNSSDMYYMPCSDHEAYMAQVEKYTAERNEALAAAAASGDGEASAWKLRAYNGTQTLCVEECVECSNDDINSERIEELKEIIENGTKETVKTRETTEDGCTLTDEEISTLCGEIKQLRDGLNVLRGRGQNTNTYMAPASYAKYSSADAPDDSDDDNSPGAMYNVESIETSPGATYNVASIESANYNATADVTALAANARLDSGTTTTFNAVATQLQSSNQLRTFSTDVVANLSSTFATIAGSIRQTEEAISDLIREKEKQLEDAGCCCPLSEEDLRDLQAQKDQISEAIVRLKTQVAKYDAYDNGDPNNTTGFAVSSSGRSATYSTILITLEAMVADIDRRIESGEDCDNSGGSTTTTSWTVIEVSNDARRAITELNSLLNDCEDCGAWRITRQGTDETFEGPECLIGWMYKDGDLQLDEARTANNAKFIVLEFKPENLLIDKRGDVYADGIKVARVALSGLIEYDFDGFYDQDLVTSMIHPKYIGNKRIFHVMQQGFHVMCHVPNSLRDELVRHEMIPYHIGTFFADRDPECHPEHAEAKDPCEIECCDPPELPDCVEIEIDGCAVTVPEWFKDWYARHKEYLYLKLPYDPRAHGDPNRYSKEEQIKFGEALIDFVISYFASTPFTPINGFESWGGVQNDMERVLNIFPVIKRPGYNRSKFKFADWIVGTNSNAPKISLPVELDDSGDPIECVDCCELIDSPCEPEIQFDDCCEGACGRWSADCQYETGDIVYSRDGVLCYKALIDICAGDCNPEPGMPAAEGIWELCSPDCENEPPVGCEFILSDNCLDRSSSCDAKLAVGALYSLSQTNSCDYRWVFTATHVDGDYDDISVESFGRFPGEQESEDSPNSLIVIEIPLLPVVCQDDTDRTNFGNSWTFKLEAYSAEGNELLKTCFSERKEYNINCDFNIALWEGIESLKAEAYNWCEDTNSDNPQAKRQPAPNSEIGTKLEEIDNAFELVLSAEDIVGLGSVPHVDFQPIGTKLTELVGLVGAIVDEDKLLELEASNASVGDRITQNMDEIIASTSDENKNAAFTDLLAYYGELKSLIQREEIYTGPEDCCCIIADPVTDTANDTCELSWVWVVNSGRGGQIPYYAGKGTHAIQSVLCAPRNPDEDQNTSVTVELFGYASTCDEVIQARVSNWAGGDWDSDTDGFNARAICSCSEQILIYCPCTPPGGLADITVVGCGDITSESYTDTEYKVNFTHVNEFNKTCEVDWFWQINDLSPNGNTNEVAAGTGLAADNIQDHVLIPGRDYKIVLRWSKVGDHSVNDSQGGVVFEQEISVPECPRLDLNFDVNFSDTTYGETSVNTVDSKSDTDYKNDMPFIGTVSGDGESSYNVVEVDSSSDANNNYWISVGDTNPYGSFTVSAQHNPDENDPKWQAVNVNDFDWRWTLSAEIGGVRVELETQQTGAVDNKVPDFVSSVISSGSTPELSGDAHKDNNYSYTVELAAVDKSTNNKFDEEVKTETNTKHKGYRSVGNITTITPSVTPTSAVSATPEVYSIGIDSSDSGATVKRQITYKPMIDFAGITTEKFNVEFEYGIGGTKENQEHTIEFTVANDPCDIIGVEIISEGKKFAPINVSNTLSESTSEIEVEYEGRLRYELDDECGNLPDNEHTKIQFEIMDMPDLVSCSNQDGLNREIIFSIDQEGERTRNSNIIEATFRFKHTWSLNADELPPNENTPPKIRKEIYLTTDATDNPIFVSLTDRDNHGSCFNVENPYTVCWDGSYAIEGECPCRQVGLNSDQLTETMPSNDFGIDVGTPMVTVTPSLNVDSPHLVEIDLSSYVQEHEGQVAKFSRFDAYGSDTSPVEDMPTISGSTLTYDLSAVNFNADEGAHTFSEWVQVHVWDQNEEDGSYIDYACKSEFVVKIEFIAGCLESGAANYVENANVSNTGIVCCPAQPVLLDGGDIYADSSAVRNAVSLAIGAGTMTNSNGTIWRSLDTKAHSKGSTSYQTLDYLPTGVDSIDENLQAWRDDNEADVAMWVQFSNDMLQEDGENVQQNPNTNPLDIGWYAHINPEDLFDIPEEFADRFRCDVRVSRSLGSTDSSGDVYLGSDIDPTPKVRLTFGNEDYLNVGNEPRMKLSAPEKATLLDGLGGIDTPTWRYGIEGGGSLGSDVGDMTSGIVEWTITAYYKDCPKPDKAQIKIVMYVEPLEYIRTCHAEGEGWCNSGDLTPELGTSEWQNDTSLCIAGVDIQMYEFWASISNRYICQASSQTFGDTETKKYYTRIDNDSDGLTTDEGTPNYAYTYLQGTGEYSNRAIGEDRFGNVQFVKSTSGETNRCTPDFDNFPEYGSFKGSKEWDRNVPGFSATAGHSKDGFYSGSKKFFDYFMANYSLNSEFVGTTQIGAAYYYIANTSTKTPNYVGAYVGKAMKEGGSGGSAGGFNWTESWALHYFFNKTRGLCAYYKTTESTLNNNIVAIEDDRLANIAVGGETSWKAVNTFEWYSMAYQGLSLFAPNSFNDPAQALPTCPMNQLKLTADNRKGLPTSIWDRLQNIDQSVQISNAWSNNFNESFWDDCFDVSQWLAAIIRGAPMFIEAMASAANAYVTDEDGIRSIEKSFAIKCVTHLAELVHYMGTKSVMPYAAGKLFDINSAPDAERILPWNQAVNIENWNKESVTEWFHMMLDYGNCNREKVSAPIFSEQSITAFTDWFAEYAGSLATSLPAAAIVELQTLLQEYGMTDTPYNPATEYERNREAIPERVWCDENLSGGRDGGFVWLYQDGPSNSGLIAFLRDLYANSDEGETNNLFGGLYTGAAFNSAFSASLSAMSALIQSLYAMGALQQPSLVFDPQEVMVTEVIQPAGSAVQLIESEVSNTFETAEDAWTNWGNPWTT